MPRTRTCDYCGGDIEPGTGTMFVRTNGATIHYCSSKCENNHDLGREARDLEWTEAGRPDEDETDGEPGAEQPDEPDVEPEIDERSGIGAEAESEAPEETTDEGGDETVDAGETDDGDAGDHETAESQEDATDEEEETEAQA